MLGSHACGVCVSGVQACAVDVECVCVLKLSLILLQTSNKHARRTLGMHAKNSFSKSFCTLQVYEYIKIKRMPDT